MSSWTLVPCLDALRDEFNTLAPGRDKRSDGTIGDQAHADRSSDHNPDETGKTPYEDSDNKNEVHAFDCDATGPWPNGVSFDSLVNVVVARHRDGRDDRLHNVIWNRRIAEESNGWKWRDYTGSNAHTEHAHFSACYESAKEADTSSWGLVDRFGDDDMDQATFNARMDGWANTANGKASLERAAKADVVDRVAPDGNPVPDSDPNPQMGVNSSLYYLARDLWEVKNDLTEVKTALAGGAPPARTASASTKSAGHK